LSIFADTDLLRANYAPVFTAMLGPLDELAKGFIVQKLSPQMPKNMVAQKDWFTLDFYRVDSRTIRHYQEMARNLGKTLVYGTGVSPLSLLRNCFDYALTTAPNSMGCSQPCAQGFAFRARASS
jgi:type III restriction enzyme